MDLRIASLSWRGERGVRWTVTAGPRRRSVAQRVLAQVRSPRTGRYRVRVRLRHAQRWLAVHGHVSTARGPAAVIRIPKSTHERPR